MKINRRNSLSSVLWPLTFIPHYWFICSALTRVSFHFVFFQRWQIIQLAASLLQSHDWECEITSTADRIIRSSVEQLKMAIDTTHKFWFNLSAVQACRDRRNFSWWTGRFRENSIIYCSFSEIWISNLWRHRDERKWQNGKQRRGRKKMKGGGEDMKS